MKAMLWWRGSWQLLAEDLTEAECDVLRAKARSLGMVVAYRRSA